jgi:hypothetical protein
MTISTNRALKEWAVAVNALEAGQTILLMRKGGIREEKGRFQVQDKQILLYPTYEHQKTHLLKPEYARQVAPVSSLWHPENVRIGSWAEITDVFTVTEEAALAQLLPYHIWGEQLARDRFNWKPRQPLSLLLLRVYKLSTPSTIPYAQEYGGCKSWIELLESISLEGSIAVLNDSEYRDRVKAIHQIVEQYDIQAVK